MEEGAVREALATRGWFIEHFERVKTAMESSANEPPLFTVNTVESQLLNMDLRSVGARSLPDHTLLRKSSHIQGPKILQVASARDISRSSIDNAFSNSQSRRLLRMKLTDGHTEITAIEYSNIPSLPNDLIPGTKINQKYSGSARSASRFSQEVDGSKPPPFERLQTGPPSHHSISHNSASTSRNTSTEKINASNQLKGDIVDNLKISANTGILQEKPNIPERPKEVAESIPVQNQAAAQKLLQKMNVQNPADRRPRGRMQRGKEIEDDHHVITLAEWEKKKAITIPYPKGQYSSTGQDEDLARQLQEQFDLEDRVDKGQQDVAAENVKLSMFNFDREDHNAYEMGSRGRGRGRARRGSSRGRGRGKGRG